MGLRTYYTFQTCGQSWRYQAGKEFLISLLQENPLNADCVVAFLYQMAVPTTITTDRFSTLMQGIETAKILSLTASVKLDWC